MIAPAWDSGGVRFAAVSRITMAGLSFLLVVILGRVVQLQLAPGEVLRSHVQQRISAREDPAVRGDLVDQRGRLLATTRLGYRLFVDPVEIAEADAAGRGVPIDEMIVALALATGVDPGEIAERVLPKLEINEERAALWADYEANRPTLPRTRLANLLPLFAGDEPDEGRGEPEGPAPPALVRFVSVGDILSDEQVERVRAMDLPGVHLERRGVREYAAPGLVASLVGKVGVDHNGLLGAEYTLDERLAGHAGSLRYVRDAYGRPLWIEPEGRLPAQRGTDVRLSIDLELQRIAHEELTRGVEDADAAGGRLVMMDPVTGQILAMLDVRRSVPQAVAFQWEDADAPRVVRDPASGPARRYITIAPDPGLEVHPALARNRCVEDVYEPGSTFKPFMWAAVTERGLARPDEVFDTEGGFWRTKYGRPIRDVTRRATMTWREVLVNSSNIGMTKGCERLTAEQAHGAIVRFGFGSPTGIGLPGEAAGVVTSQEDWSKYTHTSVSFGQEIAVTPVQMVRAFGVFARAGRAAGTLPAVRLIAPEEDDPSKALVHRIIPSELAELVRHTLRGVAEKMDGRMRRVFPDEPPFRYSMFGKSGTAQIPLGGPPPGKRRPLGWTGYFPEQYNSGFIAGAPVEAPRLVVLVVIDDPGPAKIRNREHYGSSVAGPVVRRVMERSLAYLGVTPDVPSPDRVAEASGP